MNSTVFTIFTLSLSIMLLAVFIFVIFRKNKKVLEYYSSLISRYSAECNRLNAVLCRSEEVQIAYTFIDGVSRTTKTLVKATTGSAGYDLRCISTHPDELDPNMLVVRFGIAVEIPSGYVGLLFPRSGITKTPYRLANSIGVIDSDYRGEVIGKFDIKTASSLPQDIIGNFVAQLVIVKSPKTSVIWKETLSETARGNNGFGSTSEITNKSNA